jgi:hypothetical protein
MKPKAIELSKGSRQHTAALRNHALANIGRTAGRITVRASGADNVKTSGIQTVSRLERQFLALRKRVEFLAFGEKKKNLLEWIDATLEGINTDTFLRERGQLIQAAYRGNDTEAQQMLAALAITQTGNYIAAASNWAMFFDEVSLADDERPVFTTDVGHEIAVDVIGQNGGRNTVQAQLENSQLYIPLISLATDWYEFPTSDLYSGGKVRELALANIDMMRDMNGRVDALLASYLLVGGADTRLVGAFTTTGPELERDYVAHSRVNAANLPAGNFFTLTGNTTTSKFRKEVFDQAIQYATTWGDDMGLSIVAIHIASSHANDFLGQVSLSSESNMLTDQIFEGGRIVSYAGYTFAIIADNTIDPNDGVAYIRTSEPIGNYYRKPSQDMVVEDEGADLKLARVARTAESIVCGFGLPKHWRRRVAGIRYKTPV